MAPARPDVSIIVPTRNRLGYLREALGSCDQSQDDIAIEIIVVDDGSTDGTLSWLNSQDCTTLKVSTSSGQGGGAARNRGIGLASGRYLKFLDDDDLLAPSSLRAQVVAADRSGGTSTVFGDWLVFEGDDQHGGSFVRAPRGIGEDPLVSLLRSNLLTASPLHPRDWVIQVGGFPSDNRRAQEYDFHLRLAAAGCPFVYVPGITFYSRRHASGSRISNIAPTSEHVLEFLRRVERRERLVRGASTVDQEQHVNELLAGQYWRVGRIAARLRMPAEANLCFNRSFEINPHDPREDNSRYLLLCKLVGPYGAEQIITRAKHLKANKANLPFISKRGGRRGLHV